MEVAQIVCEVCGDLVDQDKYRRHLNNGHKDKKEFRCDLCGKEFTSNYNLQYHIAHHLNERNFVCTECPQTYNTAADLAQHFRIHEKQKDPYECEYCGIFFQIRSRYNTHMRIHNNERGTKGCSVCGKVVRDLRRHHETVHLNIRNHECDICHKKFNIKSDVERHYRMVHEPQKNYICNLCGKAFGEKSLLTKHKSRHLLRSNHKKEDFCNICKIYDQNIKEHYETKHNDLKYTCEICFKKFSRSSRLKNHKAKMHTNIVEHKCDVCGRIFNNLSAIKQHVVIHMKEENSDRQDEEYEDNTFDQENGNYTDESDYFEPEIKHNDIENVNVESIVIKKEFNENKPNVTENVNVELTAVKKEPENSYDNMIYELPPLSIKSEKISDNEEDTFQDETEIKSDINYKPAKDNNTRNKDRKVMKVVDGVITCNICQLILVSKEVFRQHYMSDHVRVKNTLFSCKDCNKTFKEKKTLDYHFNTAHIKLDSENSSDKFTSNYELDEHIKEQYATNDKTSVICSFCGKKFMNERNLKLHIQGIHSGDRFPCTICGKEFSFMSAMYRHRDKEHKTGRKHKQNSLDCESCSDKFNSKYDLDEHIKAQHVISDKASVICNFCGKKFMNERNLKLHIQGIHSGDRFPCTICGKEFSFMSAMYRHRDKEHKTGRKHEFNPLNCEYCSDKFTSKYELDEHIKAQHDTSDKSVMCNLCGKILLSERNLKLHIQGIHSNNKFECEICKKSFSFESAKQRHMKSAHLPEECQCEICMKKFESRYALKYHFDRYHSGKRYTCEQCGKDFCSSSGLLRHRKGVHENIKQKTPIDFQCKICKEHLSNKYQKEKHLTQVHHNGKKLKRVCGYCKMEFQFYEDFKNHIESHAGIFICITCGESFKDLEIFDHHVESHKKIDVKLRRFQCDLCGHRVFDKVQLNVHMRKHVQDKNFYTCDICGQSYKFLTSFLYHKKLHSGKKDYVCTYCNKEFMQKQDLIVHTRKHTNEKPFKCPVCDKRFSLKFTFNVHLQTHSATRVTYKCNECGQTFFDKSELKLHDEKFHPEKRPFVCFICNMTFKHEHNLRFHNNHKHKSNTDAYEDEAGQINLNNFKIINGYGLGN